MEIKKMINVSFTRPAGKNMSETVHFFEVHPGPQMTAVDCIDFSSNLAKMFAREYEHDFTVKIIQIETEERDLATFEG